MAKLAKKLPKRTTNVKAKAKRERSWAKNQKAKEVRITEQKMREKHNSIMECTGKQRRYNPRHASED